MLQTLLKLTARFLLIPLIKDGLKALFEYFRNRQSLKKLEKENKDKGAAYENASPETAHDEFSKLP